MHHCFFSVRIGGQSIRKIPLKRYSFTWRRALLNGVGAGRKESLLAFGLRVEAIKKAFKHARCRNKASRMCVAIQYNNVTDTLQEVNR